MADADACSSARIRALWETMAGSYRFLWQREERIELENAAVFELSAPEPR